jgi:putative pyruvate formate lyase activating enzyme
MHKQLRNTSVLCFFVHDITMIPPARIFLSGGGLCDRGIPMEHKEIMDLMALYENCRLCPRQCGVNRHVRNGREKRGFCRENDMLRVAYLGAHFGEEPPITGTNGSGTIFFTGCSLRCTFCQNQQISHESFGEQMDIASLKSRVEEMVRSKRVHNINFVTPDHFFPHVLHLVSSLRETGQDLPMVYNLSGYQSMESLKIAERYADIYLPDFKYADRTLAASLSGAGDYPEVALDALSEMVRQKGFLDSCVSSATIATRGVLVRHLILPGYLENSVNVLTTLFVEFGPDIPLSLMSQYHPVGTSVEGPLKRFLKKREFDLVYAHARDLGFRNLFVQFPDPRNQYPATRQSPFLPDFHNARPFENDDPSDMQSSVDMRHGVC